MFEFLATQASAGHATEAVGQVGVRLEQNDAPASVCVGLILAAPRPRRAAVTRHTAAVACARIGWQPAAWRGVVAAARSIARV